MSIKAQLENIQWSRIDRLSPFVLLLLILALCWKLASIFWWVIAPPQVIQPEPVVLGSKQAQVPNISSFSLFYEAGASSAQANDSLPMQLQGVMVAQPSRLSSAVIKVNETAERYVIGQMIEGSSFQLAEVHWNHVVLKQSNGGSRELKFNGIENLYQPLQPEQSNTAPASSSPAPATETTQQNVLGHAIEQIGEDREEYLKKMGVNTAGGEGYEVTDQTPTALRSKLGLRPGDRIMSLNGQSVGQGQNDAQLLEQAKREGKVKIEVKRGDQTMTIQQSL